MSEQASNPESYTSYCRSPTPQHRAHLFRSVVRGSGNACDCPPSSEVSEAPAASSDGNNHESRVWTEILQPQRDSLSASSLCEGPLSQLKGNSCRPKVPFPAVPHALPTVPKCSWHGLESSAAGRKPRRPGEPEGLQGGVSAAASAPLQGPSGSLSLGLGYGALQRWGQAALTPVSSLAPPVAWV